MAKIIGIKKVDYVSKRTGKPVVGLSLYLTEADKDVLGLSCEEIYVSSASNAYDDAKLCALGDDVEVGYNKYKQICSLCIHKNK